MKEETTVLSLLDEYYTSQKKNYLEKCTGSSCTMAYRVIDRDREHLVATNNMSGQKKNFLCFKLPSKSTIKSWLNCSPSSGSPSRAPSPLSSRPPSRTGHNTHIQSENPPVSAAQAGPSYRGVWNSIESLHQCINWSTLVAKDYVEITLNGTLELMKIAKESSAVLAPLSSALGGVLACVDLYKVGSIASLTSTLPYSIHRERLATTKRWIES